MRSKTIIFFAAISALICSWGIIPAHSADNAFPKVVSLGTPSVGDGYNMVGVGAAKVWDKDFGLKAMVAPGSAVQNYFKFGKGRLDIVVARSSFSKAAWVGYNALGFPQPIQNFRVLCYIFPEMFHFVALKKSGLRNVSDLKGKRVGCGSKASTYDQIIGKRLEANGIKYFGASPDIKKTFSNDNDLALQLRDGNLDATLMGVSGIAPSPALQKLMKEKELVALEWSETALDYKDPIFVVGKIKKEILPYLDKDHSCIVGSIASFVVRQEFSDEFAYSLTKSIHQNLPKMAEENPYYKYPARYPEILTYDAGIPYHPGAVKYWKEVGAWNR